jgi:hypothetical protein
MALIYRLASVSAAQRPSVCGPDDAEYEHHHHRGRPPATDPFRQAAGLCVARRKPMCHRHPSRVTAARRAARRGSQQVTVGPRAVSRRPYLHRPVIAIGRFRAFRRVWGRARSASFPDRCEHLRAGGWVKGRVSDRVATPQAPLRHPPGSETLVRRGKRSSLAVRRVGDGIQDLQ